MNQNLDHAKSETQEEGNIPESSMTNITLRPIELSDVDDFMMWATDERVTRFCLWSTYPSKEQAVDYIKNHAIPHPWLRLICLDDNRAVGSITVTPCTDSGYDRCRAEIGYVVAHEYWGRGIATLAVKMAAAAIFKEWPHLRRLQGVADVDNRGSQRVLEKSGFEREGVLRNYVELKGKIVDVVMYSIVV
ncbi:hypothetical protein ACP275_07G033200 [Erythranthe tilingii]